MRRLALLAAAAAVFAGLGAGVAAPARQVVFAEDSTLHETRGTLWPGQERVLDLRVDQENVTRVEVHLRWEGEAAFGLALRGPDGRHAAAPPAQEDPGRLSLALDDVHPVPEPIAVAPGDEAEALARAASHEGKGTWRVSLTMDEASPEARDYTLLVVVYHYDAIPVRVVTLAGSADAPLAPPSGWTLVLAGMAGLAAALGIRILAPGAGRQAARRGASDPASVLPGGDNTPSSGTGQGGCAAEK